MDLPRTGRERRAGVIIENINELLKNKAPNRVHSRRCSEHNFPISLCTALTAYHFLGNKPEALSARI